MKPGAVIPITDQYDREYSLYSDYASALNSLIRDLLAAERIKVHSVEGRVKDRTSPARKVLSDLKYLSLHDVTDVAGLRIITYFADEVDRVAEIIEREIEPFKKDDKRISRLPNEFGYRSLHYVVGFKAPRSGLFEYRRFAQPRLPYSALALLGKRRKRCLSRPNFCRTRRRQAAGRYNDAR